MPQAVPVHFNWLSGVNDRDGEVHTTEYLSGNKHTHRVCKHWDKDHSGHPNHSGDIGWAASESILCETVESETDELTADRGVGQGCLPFR